MSGSCSQKNFSPRKNCQAFYAIFFGGEQLRRENNSSSKGVADRVAYEDFRTPATNRACDDECRDPGMLQGLQQYIDQNSDQDILIVLHTMGSHGPAYSQRYPAAFSRFTPTCKSNQLDTCSEQEIINAYDNTLLFTDYFLGQTIGLLKRNDDRFETAMWYVSDHGESLGELGIYLHGMPYLLAPKAQTHVASVMWLGENFVDLEMENLHAVENQPLSHDNVFHTLLGLFEINSAVYAPELDILRQTGQSSPPMHRG